MSASVTILIRLEPSAHDYFLFRVEAHGVLMMCVQVAEERVFSSRPDNTRPRRRHIWVGHHDQVVLGVATGLHPLAFGGGDGVDVLRERRGSNEADGLGQGVVDRVRGTLSEGLSIKLLPQAMAEGCIHMVTMAGKLNGVMPAETNRPRQA
jgi:hypothetical protein